MIHSIQNGTVIISLVVLCFFQQGCTKENSEIDTTEGVVATVGNANFGRTDVSAYTPEIRANMKKLYHDKFDLFVHFGPHTQLEGVCKGKRVAAEWIMR